MAPTSTNYRSGSDRTRQGETGHNVRYVLAWSLALAVTAMLVAGVLA